MKPKINGPAKIQSDLFPCTSTRVCWKSSWDCSIFHVFREVNFAADSLAKMGHEMEMGIHCFVLPPGGITGVLQEDRDGLLRSRLIYV
ncbi:hypothetical protein L3X38_000006 [Prunus dulcis]|uniref:RNase H type-1 domain-containing protein n=1 Tax=Prunus dulcis TaxID=3755 RepID=A0AAD4UQI7_PRUDU|nr:hypothetical protein L3X38_000006 [Prunus dulcis]